MTYEDISVPAIFKVALQWTSSVNGGHVTIRFPIGHFLSVVLWNQASISKDFRDIQWRT